MKEVTFTIEQVRAMMDEVRADERACCTGGQAPSLKGKPVTQSEIDRVASYLRRVVLGTQRDEYGNRENNGIRGHCDIAMVVSAIVKAYNILERER
jgi:hypothetical protein